MRVYHWSPSFCGYLTSVTPINPITTSLAVVSKDNDFNSLTGLSGRSSIVAIPPSIDIGLFDIVFPSSPAWYLLTSPVLRRTLHGRGSLVLKAYPSTNISWSKGIKLSGNISFSTSFCPSVYSILISPFTIWDHYCPVKVDK